MEPPYTTADEFATALAALVPDTKAQSPDSDLIAHALGRYSEQSPSWETADVGDGSLFEWDLSASPFGNFQVGFSDVMGVVVEELDSAGAPYRPPVKLTEGRDHYLDRRTVGGVAKLYLVFVNAPPSTKLRVRWRKVWVLLEVPSRHHDAIVSRAAARKCIQLASTYADSVDPTATATDLFNAEEKAQAYRDMAAGFFAEFNRVLGIGGSVTGLATGKIRTGQNRVFPGGHLRGGTIGQV